VSGGGLRYDRLSRDGCELWLTVLGSDAAPTLLFLPPLFEELNRTRALLLQTMRALAAGGWRCVLPDLPGTGESEIPLDAVEWRHWRDAVTAASAGAVAAVSLRGGALLDGVIARRWRLSPATGAALVRDLERTGLTGASGYAPSAGLLDALRAAEAEAGAARTARLVSDPAPADVRFEASPLWRRSEPAGSPALAAAMAGDIAAWLGPCAAS